MPEVGTSRRLRWCMQHGAMSKTDLARWLGRSYATVHAWVDGAIPGAKGGRLPRGPKQVARVDEVMARLGLLEFAISNKHGFPLSLTESERERTKTIERIRNELERTGVLARRPA